MTNQAIIGVKPMLPWPLAQSRWWTEPVRAEPLAALRIGVGLVLLLDVVGTYLPRAGDFFGGGSLADPGTYTSSAGLLEWHRIVLEQATSPGLWQGVLILWALSGLFLLVGVFPRSAAALAWFFSVSVTRINPAMHNSGDQVRNALLLLLALCPCGACWSLSSWWRPHREKKTVLIYPWPLRLALIYLVVIYFMNGLYKLRGPHWHSGDALSIVLGDVSWTRWSFANWWLPGGLLAVLTWLVLVWELGFPVFVCMPALRGPTLLLGIAFHVGNGLCMQLGPFPLYMLCLYLPLAPWERWLQGREEKSAAEVADGVGARASECIRNKLIAVADPR